MTGKRKIILCVLLVVLCIAARFVVGAFSLNFFDFKNFLITGEIAASGRNVYAEQKFYNYGPAFFILLGWLYKAASHFPNIVIAFKLMLVLVFTIADVFIARIITKKAGFKWGMLFLLNPISLLNVSYNSQFDVIATAFAAYGLLYLERSAQNEKFTFSDIAGTLLLSMSLIMKHILWAFPLWLLLNENILPRKKFLYAFVPPLLFLLSFAPYWSLGHQGIIDNVFLYRSAKNFPLIAWGVMQNIGISSPVLDKISFSAYILLVSLAGYIFRREKVYESFLLYTMATVCLSSGIWDSYCSIPLMAVFIFVGKGLIPLNWITGCVYVVPYLAIRGKFLAGLFGMVYDEYTKKFFLNIRVVPIVWCLLFWLVYYYRHHTSR